MVSFALLILLSSCMSFAGCSSTPRVKDRLTDQFDPQSFKSAVTMMWGSGHGQLSDDNMNLRLKLDQISGSGIVSNRRYMYGFFSSAIKLPSNYSAGVVTTFYGSNKADYPLNHDEIDFEFLGTVPGEAYIVQTNIYGNGSTDIGREQRFRLWFDPTSGFHHYSILWTPYHILFLVDNVPIRQTLNALGTQLPSKPMRIYASIWDGSPWATDGGRYKADYSYGPFVAEYAHLILSGCDASTSPLSCISAIHGGRKGISIASKLSSSQLRLLKWVQKNHLVYDYCKDYARYPAGLPECTVN